MPHLLLLHGALGSGAQMEGLKGHVDSDREVEAIDLPGHGGDPLPEAPYSFELFTGRIKEWMDKKGLESIDIFGYSMGGYAGLKSVGDRDGTAGVEDTRKAYEAIQNGESAVFTECLIPWKK